MAVLKPGSGSQETKLLLASGFLIFSAIMAISGQHPSRTDDKADLDFLETHWQRPIPPQGRPPASFSEVESSLDPASCGVCHQSQYDDWKTTVHGRAVGPGLLGQTPNFLRHDPGTAAECYSCHAPLAEQQEIYSAGSGFKRNSRFDAALQREGVTCAVCHVRGQRRFGPPVRDGTPADAAPDDQQPHGGAIRTAAFERAEFCMSCHQFQPGDRALNGKLLENTYNEWRSSPFAEREVSCQQCHMPDRKHLWRGIHDPEMVRRGVDIKVHLNQDNYKLGDTLEATLTLTNSGVGHYFPTYVTPKVVLTMELLDSTGNPARGTVRQEAVGREATLDISQEVYDTRIPPGSSHAFRYSQVLDRAGLRLHAKVLVYPDDFYRRFYEAKLEGPLSATERRMLSAALEATQKSQYTVFERVIPL